jgi:hypothetical protein
MIEKSNNIRNIYKMPLIDYLTHKDFITYCILLGNDYIDNLKYFKYDKIFEYLVINDFKIDKFLNHIKNIYSNMYVVFNIEDYLNNYLIKFYQVYNYYINAKVFDPFDIQYNKNDIDINMIEKIMCEYHNFDKNIINYELSRLKKIPQFCALQEPPIYNRSNNFFSLLDSYD